MWILPTYSAAYFRRQMCSLTYASLRCPILVLYINSSWAVRQGNIQRVFRIQWYSVLSGDQKKILQVTESPDRILDEFSENALFFEMILWRRWIESLINNPIRDILVFIINGSASLFFPLWYLLEFAYQGHTIRWLGVEVVVGICFLVAYEILEIEENENGI